MSQGVGNFSSLTVGTGDAVNTFNADGSYSIMGTGNFGVIRAAQFNGSSYHIGSASGNNNLGLLFGGIGALTGLNIYPANSSVPGSSGNIVFANGNYLNQGIVFADNSFLNSASNFTNINSITINTDNINSKNATFKSINVDGDLNGTNLNLNINTINGINSTFKSITGETAIITNLNSTNNNNITTNTNNLIFSDGSNLSSGPGSKTIRSTINENCTTTGPNAQMSIPKGNWLITFNLYFNNIPAVNYVTCPLANSGAGSIFAVIPISGQTISTCSGSYFLKNEQDVNVNVDFTVNTDTTIDKTKSYHHAINLS
jgi:hypothetical protein